MTGLPFSPASAGMDFNYGDQSGGKAKSCSMVIKRVQTCSATENDKTFTTATRRMKAQIHGPVENSSSGWPHPSLGGEVDPTFDTDGGTMTSATNRYPDFRLQSSLPPSRSAFV